MLNNSQTFAEYSERCASDSQFDLFHPERTQSLWKFKLSQNFRFARGAQQIGETKVTHLNFKKESYIDLTYTL